MRSNGDGIPGSRLGPLLRAYRREAGLTQEKLAEKAGLSVAALRDIEQGRRFRPRQGTLTALADALSLGADHAARLTSAARNLTVLRPTPESGSGLIPGPMRPGPGLWMAVLGPLEAWRDGTPLSLGPPTRRALLGLLLLYPGVPIRRNTIIDVLWEQEPPRTAVGLVQAHVSRLRQSLEPCRHLASDVAVFHSDRGAYRLSLSAGELDLLLFRDLASRAETARARGDDVTACELYEHAIRLWRGDPLADVDVLSDHPGVSLLRQELVGVLLRYAEDACTLGQCHRVLPRLQALTTTEPLNEWAHACLMIALAASGQQAAAIQVYENLRTRLDLELGLYPSEQLVEAHMRVLRQDIGARPRARVCTQRSTEASDLPHTLPSYAASNRCPPTWRWPAGSP